MRKIPTLFVRDFEHDNGRYVTEEVTPGCEWVLDGIGAATRKLDGTCVRVGTDGAMSARREVKRGKPYPPNFEPIETDGVTGKTIGWEPASQSSFAKILCGIYVPTEPGTYELIGPKVNGNPEGEARHVLVPHGRIVVDLADRSFDGIRGWCADHPQIEGIVFWERPADLAGKLAKIKARDFRHG